MLPEWEYVTTVNESGLESLHRTDLPVVPHLVCRRFRQAWESKGVWGWLVKNRPKRLMSLVRQGADRDDPRVQDLLAAGQSLDSTLIAAAETEDVSVVQKLINWGADVRSAVYERQRWNCPLYAACYNHNMDVIKLLLDKGADPSLGLHGVMEHYSANDPQDELSDLDHNPTQACLQMLGLLLDHGADPNHTITGYGSFHDKQVPVWGVALSLGFPTGYWLLRCGC